MYEDTPMSLQDAMFDAGYQDGYEEHTPHPNPTEPASYGKGYDAGFMRRHDMSWTHELEREV